MKRKAEDATEAQKTHTGCLTCIYVCTYVNTHACMYLYLCVHRLRGNIMVTTMQSPFLLSLYVHLWFFSNPVTFCKRSENRGAGVNKLPIFFANFLVWIDIVWNSYGMFRFFYVSRLSPSSYLGTYVDINWLLPDAMSSIHVNPCPGT